MRLILLGPPGGGKGTQAKLLAQHYNLEHISTGDLLRAAAAAGTPLGLRAKPYMDAGKLAPDELVNDLVAERFRSEDRPERFVLDGYPRTLSQAAALDAVLREQFLDLTAVILLNVDDNEIVRRLSSRGRADDRPETVRARLVVYHNETEELVPHYQKQGLLMELSGEGDIEAVYNNIMKVLTPKVGPSC